MLYSLLHPTTKHLNRSIGYILVFPCTGVNTMADSSQLTQGGSKVGRSCQSTIVGAVCVELRQSDRNLRTAWFEKRDSKNPLSGFWIIGWMCTRTSNTYLFKQLRLNDMTPLKIRLIKSLNVFSIFSLLIYVVT